MDPKPSWTAKKQTKLKPPNQCPCCWDWWPKFSDKTYLGEGKSQLIQLALWTPEGHMCLQLAVWDVRSQLFLPPHLHSAVVEYRSRSPGNTFVSKLPRSWCCLGQDVYHCKRKVSNARLCSQTRLHAAVFLLINIGKPRYCFVLPVFPMPNSLLSPHQASWKCTE